MTGRRRWALIAVLLLTVAIFSRALPALAHAQLVRSDPPENASLPVSPKQVQAWFSEEVEPAFSELTVLDKGGARKDNHDSAAVPNDHKSMTVSVPDLSQGTYTVVWKTLSAVDGHAVKGAFYFAIGEAVAAPPLSTQPPLEPPPDFFGAAV